MLYFLCPDSDDPIGGVKVIYKIVDTLNAEGRTARVLHFDPGFRCTWFKNETKVTSVNERTYKPKDIIFVPEVFVPIHWEALKQTTAKLVILVQGGYLIPTSELNARQNGIGPISPEPYNTALGTVCISQDTADFVKMMYPRSDTYLLNSYLNDKVFYYQKEKIPQVCFMPRRNYELLLPIFKKLEAEHFNHKYNFIPLHNMEEMQVANKLRESAFFFSAATFEGFNLPAAEALACGTTVIGWDGFGGREFFSEDYMFPVPTNDIKEFGRVASVHLENYLNDPVPYQILGEKASKYILNKYSWENWRKQLLDTIEKLENKAGINNSMFNTNKDRPKVTVGICSYNQLEYLKQAIESVREQTIPCKIIVGDDGSTDGTKEWLKSQKDIEYVTHHNNSGNMVRAWNDIIKRVETEWLILLSGDDMLIHNAAELISSTENADWVFGGLQLTDGEGRPTQYWDLSNWPIDNEESLKWTWNTDCIPHTMFAGFRTMWIKENNLKAIEMKDTKYGQDTATSIMWTKLGNPRVVRLNTPLFLYRRHESTDFLANYGTPEAQRNFHEALRKFMTENFDSEEIKSWE